MLTHKDILLKLQQLEKRVSKQDKRTKKNEEDLQMIFEAVKELLDPSQKARPRIGFRRSGEE